MTYLAHYTTPLGPVTLASNGEMLTGLWFDGQKCFGSTIQESARASDLPIFDQTRNWLDLYFSGINPAFTPPLLIQGSPFFLLISQLMQQIAYGSTTTYGHLAQKAARILGRNTCSAQAVGGAVGHNPISIIIPCHRVLGAKGQLTGYAGGIQRKIALLQLENGEISPNTHPKNVIKLDIY